MTVIILILLGLAFGSFINALVWRLRQQERVKGKEQRANKPQDLHLKTQYSMTKGRSQCTRCGHLLSAKDLVPILSWIFLRGKCRYCGQPISWQYPAVELATAVLFVASYLYWPSFQRQSLETVDVVGFGVWLAILTGLVALAIYDIRWMLLPNRIIFPLYGLAVLGIVSEALLTTNYYLLTTTAAGAAVGGGIFYILFQLSGGKWIGGGDVKLGFLLGLIVGGPGLAFLMLFLASLLGTAASLPLILAGRTNRTSRIPFGPFLITAAIIVQLFGTDMINQYTELILS